MSTTTKRMGKAGHAAWLPILIKPLILALSGALVAVLTWAAWPTSIEHRDIESAYAYDVSDLRVLNGQADNIVFATVEEVVDSDGDAVTTSFAVQVTDVVKGDLTGRQVVQQLGFSETAGKTHTVSEDPDQPLLKPGTQVLLTLGREPDGRNTVMGGPRSVVVLNDQIDRAALRAERVRAAKLAIPVTDPAGSVVYPIEEAAIHD